MAGVLRPSRQVYASPLSLREIHYLDSCPAVINSMYRKGIRSMQNIHRIKTYKGPVKAVVLDWAGTTVDYGCMGPVAPFVEVFGHRGIAVSIEEARKPMGMMKKEHIRAMCEMDSIVSKWQGLLGRRPEENDVEEMYREVEPLMVEAIGRHSDLIPGLLDAVSSFREYGVKIGSNSGYPRSVMEVLVAQAGNKGYHPDTVVCATDVPAGRPYPWMCYQNAINLQVYPLESVVKIGDTVNDIQEGLNAGMWTVGITQTGNELGLTVEECHAVDAEFLHTRLTDIGRDFLEAGAHFVAAGIWECPRIIQEINTRLALGERP